MRPTIWSLGFAVLGLVLPLSLEAQTTAQAGEGVTVQGFVSDQVTEETVAAVRVVLVQFGPDGEETVFWEGLTDENGTFAAERVPYGRYQLRADALGYQNVKHTLGFAEPGRVQMRVEMVPEAIQLEPIVVTAFSQSRMETGGFYERRASGFGYTFTREEIEARGPTRVSDLFSGIAGARVVRSPPGPSRVLLRGGCVPRVVIDGTPFAFPVPIDTVLQPHELEAIEVYHGASAPAQFLGDSCGTVMLWTRETTKLPGKPFSWVRILVGVGLFGVTLAVGAF